LLSAGMQHEITKMTHTSKDEMKTNILQTTPAWRTARLAMFTALSAVGSLIKIPSPIGSLALDSSPGFFAALFFGPIEGAVVCGLGHIATATISGFPLGYLHIPIALGMALAGAAMGLLNRLNKKWGFLPSLIIGVIINTALVFPLAPLLAEEISVGWMIAISYAPFLLAAACLNAVVAGAAYVGIRGKIRI
jgi:uncharacterized membrane protein